MAVFHVDFEQERIDLTQFSYSRGLIFCSGQSSFKARSRKCYARKASGCRVSCSKGLSAPVPNSRLEVLGGSLGMP